MGQSIYVVYLESNDQDQEIEALLLSEQTIKLILKRNIL